MGSTTGDNNFLDDDLPRYQEDFVAVVLLLLFPVFVFNGHRQFRTVLAGSAGAFGAYAGLWLTSSNLQMLGPVMSLLFVVFIAAAAAMLALRMQRLGVFFLGAMAGLLLANLLYQWIANTTRFNTEFVHWVVVVGFSLLGGVALTYIEMPLLTLLTSFIGAYFGVAGIDYFIARLTNLEQTPRLWPTTFFQKARYFKCDGDLCYAEVGAWAALFLIGVAFQTTMIEHRRRHMSPGSPRAAGYILVPANPEPPHHQLI